MSLHYFGFETPSRDYEHDESKKERVERCSGLRKGELMGTEFPNLTTS